jgi:phosphatidylglycerol:prolipoprotein diacylglycerol transferase
MLPTLNVGPFIFPTTGLVLIFGAWLCLMVVERAARRLNLDVKATYTLAVVGLFAGFVGARLLFVGLYWPAYQQNWLGIIWPLTSGYEPVGGLVIGGTAAFFYGRAHNLPFAATLDALAPGLILAFIVISLADFLAGPGYGTLTAVPWGISQYGLRRHPVQLYEMAAGALALAVWWRWVDGRAYAGQLFLITAATYSAARLFLDAFRENTWLTSSGYHAWQLLSFAVLLISLTLLIRNEK